MSRTGDFTKQVPLFYSCVRPVVREQLLLSLVYIAFVQVAVLTTLFLEPITE